MNIRIKRGVAVVLVTALAVTTGIITGKAIVANKNKNSKLENVVYEYDALPEELQDRTGKTPNDYTALQNYQIAKFLMQTAESVEAHSTGTADGKSFGITQKQTSASTKKYDGSAAYAEFSSKSVGGIYKVNVAHRMFQEDGSKTVYNRHRDRTDDYEEDWKVYTQDQHVKEFGSVVKNFIPYIVTEQTVAESSVEAADGGFRINLTMNADAAAINYKRQVLVMSGSDKAPEYRSLTIQLLIDENWVLGTVITDEVYDVKVFGLNATTTAHSEDVYRINTKDVVIAAGERPETV